MRTSNTVTYSVNGGWTGILVGCNSRFVSVERENSASLVTLTFEADEWVDGEGLIVVDKYLMQVGNDTQIGELVGATGDGIPGHNIGVWLHYCGPTVVQYDSTTGLFTEPPLNSIYTPSS